MYNLVMTGDVFINAFFIFITLVVLVGGLMSIAWEKFYKFKNPFANEKLFHIAIWSKNLKIEPRHLECKECDKEVARIKETRDRRIKARRS